MNNDHFEDMAVLSTIAQLYKRKLLGGRDLADLRNQLRSEWGRRALEKMEQNDMNPDPDDRLLLQRYSKVFAR